MADSASSLTIAIGLSAVLANWPSFITSDFAKSVSWVIVQMVRQKAIAWRSLTVTNLQVLHPILVCRYSFLVKFVVLVFAKDERSVAISTECDISCRYPNLRCLRCFLFAFSVTGQANRRTMKSCPLLSLAADSLHHPAELNPTRAHYRVQSLSLRLVFATLCDLFSSPQGDKPCDATNCNQCLCYDLGLEWLFVGQK